MDTNNVSTMSAIDRALAQARARKAVKDETQANEAAEEGGNTWVSEEPNVIVEKKTKNVVNKSEEDRTAERDLKDKARAEKLASLKAERIERKNLRDLEKISKKAAKKDEDDSKAPSHMKKVDKARSKLPKMTTDAEIIFGEATANLTAQQIDALAQHLLVHNRAMATVRAMTTSKPIELGSTVRIIGGDPRYLGMEGTVTHSKKLRTALDIKGVGRWVYVYTCDAELVHENVMDEDVQAAS